MLRCESVKIDMGLNGKITPVQSPGHLLMNVVPRPFNIFGSIGYDKTLAMTYKPYQPGYFFALGDAFGSFRWFLPSIFADNMIFRDGIYSFHGFTKEPLLMLRIRRRLPFGLMRFLCRFGTGRVVAVNQALQAVEGIMHQ